MAVLSEELEQLRFEKRESEVEHIRKEHERNLEVEALTKEKTELEQDNTTGKANEMHEGYLDIKDYEPKNTHRSPEPQNSMK